MLINIKIYMVGVFIYVIYILYIHEKSSDNIKKKI